MAKPHRTGLLPLDQAVFETIIGRYIEMAAAARDLRCTANAPVGIIKLPFRARSPGYLHDCALSAVALLVRPMTSRPRSDLPSAKEAEQVQQDLEVELELSVLGLTTMRHASYRLIHKRGAYWVDVMGFPKHITPETPEQRAILDGLLDGRSRRQFRYPNVQVGYAGRSAQPRLIDFGGVDLIDRRGWDWLLRAHSCAFEIFRLPTDDFAPFLSQGFDVAQRIEQALRGESDTLLKALEEQGVTVSHDPCSVLEEISILIARLADYKVPVDAHIDRCVDTMTQAAMG